MLLFSCCYGYTPWFWWKCYFLMICMTEQESFAGQESFEIRREICVPYPCRISCFRLFSVNSHLLFAFSYLIFIDLLCLLIFNHASFTLFFCMWLYWVFPPNYSEKLWPSILQLHVSIILKVVRSWCYVSNCFFQKYWWSGSLKSLITWILKDQ